MQPANAATAISGWLGRRPRKCSRHAAPTSRLERRQGWLQLRALLPPTSYIAGNEAKCVIWEHLNSACGALILNQVLDRKSPFQFEFDEEKKRMVIRVFKNQCPAEESFMACFPNTRFIINGEIPRSMQPSYPFLHCDLGLVYVIMNMFKEVVNFPKAVILFEVDGTPDFGPECLDCEDVYKLCDWLDMDTTHLFEDLYFNEDMQCLVVPPLDEYILFQVVY
jgi:hypothetical protein